MKKITFALLFLLTLTSCHDNVLEFSCNPEINKYVAENPIYLAQLNLDEFLEQAIPVQRAAFRSYTSEKRLELWIEKLERTLLLGNWSEQEITHITKLENNLSNASFEKKLNTNPPLSENDLFMKQWIDYAQNTLKWDKVKLAFVVSSLYFSKTEYNLALINTTGPYNLGNDCNCNTGTDFCTTEFHFSCHSSDCNASTSGCGWLWMQSCNGVCKGNIQENI